MRVKKIAYFIPMFILLLVLSACSGKAEKVVVKPLTKDQVMTKVSQQLKKQTKLIPTQYHLKESLIAGGWVESKIDYYGVNEYYTQSKYSDGSSDEQVYQLPGYQYNRDAYEGEKKEWSKIPYERPFKEDDIKSLTSSGSINDLKAQTYFSILESVQGQVQMKETGKAYVLDLTSTDTSNNLKWMQGYLKHYDVIDPKETAFQKYHTKMVIDKKTFAVQSIENEVFYTRQTFNPDNGVKGQKHLDIQTVIEYPTAKKLIVPQNVINEADKNDPYKQFEQQFQQK
ncbi:hypothetical protein MK805_14365 [Shimazuella sp. AN120528]|uniref:hypothetical protein n=1 Tax=Shimazuella soli TaxID=1892854 RepID=UPI001F0EDBB1|nr:hypothetical protein [Shimazuella soli]MCH5586122.1 hypothetical protein [Shimazuella soli]